MAIKKHGRVCRLCGAPATHGLTHNFKTSFLCSADAKAARNRGADVKTLAAIRKAARAYLVQVYGLAEVKKMERLYGPPL